MVLGKSLYQSIEVVKDTARKVSWNLFIGNLYKWKNKEFLLLFLSANEQIPHPHKTQLLQ